MALVFSANSVLWLKDLGGAAVAKESKVSISRTVPREYAVALSAFNLRLSEIHVAPGERPTLAGGVRCITDQEAVSKALKRSGVAQNGQLLPGVEVAARFGMFSNYVFAKGGPGVPMHLVYQDHPAWIVTFFGPELTILLDAPARIRGGEPPMVLHHAESLVIDAVTGEYMMQFT